MAIRAEESGVKGAATYPLTLLVLSVLAGACISFGAELVTTVSVSSIVITVGEGIPAYTSRSPYGVVALFAGLVVSMCPALAVIGGAELFTGNKMIVMASANGTARTGDLLLNRTIAFTGNCVGASPTAGLMFVATQYTFDGGSVELIALAMAEAKASLGFVTAFALGIMCNALVCLAVWMCYSARTTVDRILTIVPPIAALVAAGFEHSIANVYFLPMGLFDKAGAPEAFWASLVPWRSHAMQVFFVGRN